MYKRIKMSSTTQNIGGGAPAVLNYYMIVNRGADGEEYGCEVELIRPDAAEKNETSRIYGISPERELVERLIGRLSAGAVTPCTLYDIVYDHISEQ